MGVWVFHRKPPHATLGALTAAHHKERIGREVVHRKEVFRLNDIQAYLHGANDREARVKERTGSVSPRVGLFYRR